MSPGSAGGHAATRLPPALPDQPTCATERLGSTRYTKLIAAAAALTLAAAVPAVADPDPIDALTANVVVAPEVLV
ncbi:MAG: hypothetical protein WAZ15_01245, partial [Propioniciclava sp.]